MKIREMLKAGRSFAMAAVVIFAQGAGAAEVTFDRDVLPILSQYCAGCHQGAHAEEELSVQTFADLMRGGEHGPVIKPGDSQQSRLWQVVSGQAEPKMPPDEEPQPSADQLSILKEWIDAGAQPPVAEAEKEESPVRRAIPSLAPKPITALAWSPRGDLLAVGRFAHVDLVTPEGQFVERLDGMPGKVTSVSFHPQGEQLLVATGSVGVAGEAWIWDLPTRSKKHVLAGHRDILYAARFSPDGQRIATAGYDRTIRIWDGATGEFLRALEGHHGAIYDLAFSADHLLLASASADSTVKVWQVETGSRLDTLSQPLKEQLSVDISPDGSSIVAAGADNRLRLWKLVSRNSPEINPLLIARYAHEQPVQQVRFSADGKQIFSLAADRTLKVWDAVELKLLETFAQESDVAQTFALHPQAESVVVGRMDGATQRYPLSPLQAASSRDREQEGAPANGVSTNASSAPIYSAASEPTNAERVTELAEQEPNDSTDDAQLIAVPAIVQGRIFREAAVKSQEADRDLFRFSARKGDTWLVEVNAARQGSPLDSVVRVLDAEGQPVPRVLMRAIRDSYFTFRGKDSHQTGDFRLHNWEEMRLNQFLYAAGEVVKLYHYPRGPDSGFNVYPNFGNRHTYFDTTSVSHALNEPAYIVEPHAPDESLAANGLPVFPIYFENDDESQRRFGTDSLLHFTAPRDGDYFVQLQDVRQAEGESFGYRLLLRRPQPDFSAKLSVSELKVPLGAGQSFQVEVERIDGFDGPIQIELEQPAGGWVVTSPLIVEPGHLRAAGIVFAPVEMGNASAPPAPVTIHATAVAKIGDQTVRREAGTLGPIQWAPAPPVTVEIVGNRSERTASGLPIIEIEPGTTQVIQVRITRGEFKDRVSFGGEDALFNVPHGVFVANIGLNGVLITEAESERDVFIRAEPWVKAGEERLVYMRAEVNGNPTSAPALLRIR